MKLHVLGEVIYYPRIQYSHVTLTPNAISGVCANISLSGTVFIVLFFFLSYILCNSSANFILLLLSCTCMHIVFSSLLLFLPVFLPLLSMFQLHPLLPNPSPQLATSSCLCLFVPSPDHVGTMSVRTDPSKFHDCLETLNIEGPRFPDHFQWILI